ncbi:hypothetical protein HD598_001036 [Neomicrococcus aestuarii]|uniref:Rhodanese domain-containing protein n=1 Tax=Neomicrococcus aestuarii TaxID=556325 RepID=A0A7W8TSZ6_9MICC|nr:hypothetical protein [Neomicrococcus aestuarii]MBB5512349.1 hypothetical protein [Neomicrococcus aestuarii]
MPGYGCAGGNFSAYDDAAWVPQLPAVSLARIWLDEGSGAYPWGPGCNGSTRAALTLRETGYTNVKELIGGFEYWAREGMAISTANGRTRRPVDDLTAPLS